MTGTANVALQAPVLSVVQEPTNTPLKSMLTLSPAANADTAAAMLAPATPEFGARLIVGPFVIVSVTVAVCDPLVAAPVTVRV